ncbi:MAG: hypothetical protein JO149_07465 [Gammaproteobacteria bacterium]|nr:hypothetical protein [Gammaproteobacteria bacterium]
MLKLEKAFAQHDIAINILLVVWGKKYIEDFLQFSLPSLLAPNNVPLLTSHYKTCFKFLACQQDVEIFEKNPAYQMLKSLCEIEFIFIDDLIVFGYYATTITLAYERAIRLRGTQMLNTYFILLTSDFIIADGSMKGLLEFIQAGYHAVYAGTLQVIKKEIEPFLLKQIKSNSSILSVLPRDLLKESFSHLHPMVFANRCNQNLVHNYRAYRFYFSLDKEVLASRHYLLHPVCIKPETIDYKINSSFDYSFVPEMCPSGKTVVMNDSDKFLIVEIQEKEHELEFITKGKYEIKKLGRALAEWTTAHHRKNARYSLYFHLRDLTENDKSKTEKALDQFVDEVNHHLKKYETKPVNEHPYWANTIKAFDEQKNILQQTKEENYVDLSVLSHINQAKKNYYRCFGAPPKVYKWHYRWQEYHGVMKALQLQLQPADMNATAIFYDNYQTDFMCYRRWFEENLGIKRHYHMYNAFNNEARLDFFKALNLKKIVLLVKLENLDKVKKTLNKIKEIAPEGDCFIFAIHGKNSFASFERKFWGNLLHELDFSGTHYQIAHVDFIQSNLTFLGAKTIEKIDITFAYSRKLRFLSYIIFGMMGSVYCLIRNSLPIFSKQGRGHCTNVLISLTPSE